MSDKKDITQGNTGNRYTPETKEKVVAFYNSQLDEEGNIKRGTAKITMEKFNISYISLRNWLGMAGSPKKEKKAKATPKVAKESNGKRGRKANPTIAFARLLEKMKNQHDKASKQIEKALVKIQGK